MPLCFFLFRGDAIQKLFAWTLNFMTTGFIAALSLEIATIFSPYESESFYSCFIVIYPIMYSGYIVSVALFWRRIFKMLFVNEKRSLWIMYTLGAAFSFAVLTTLRITLQTGPIYTVMIVFVFFSYIVMCSTIINANEKTKQRYETEIARDIVSSREYYHKMDEMYGKLRILRHDYRQNLNAIGKMFAAGNKDEIDQYLTDIQAQLSETELESFCSNTVINALLASYAERCVKLDIAYVIEVYLPESLSVPNYELCIILGNLLENAVEACQQQDNNRTVEVLMKPLGEQLAVRVRNGFTGQITEKDGQPLSTKQTADLDLKA